MLEELGNQRGDTSRCANIWHQSLSSPLSFQTIQ